MSLIIDYLEGKGLQTKKKTAKEYSSACPKCGGEDRFNIWPEEDRFWCRKCDWKGDYIQLLIDHEGYDFVAAAKAAGQEYKLSSRGQNQVKTIEKLKHPTHGLPDIQYKYMTLAGDVHLVVCRWEANDKGRLKKLIAQYNPYSNTWTKINEITPILYNLQMVTRYNDVYFVEGEKCVETLRDIGLAATTVAGGSSSASKFVEWQDKSQTFDSLSGKNVYILPDNDISGIKFAENAAAIISMIAKDVKIIKLQGLPMGGDVVDYIKRLPEGKGARQSLEAEALNAPGYRPYTTASTLYRADYSHEPDLIFGGVLPYAGHMLIAGEAGVGKSLLRMELALHLAAGVDWLDWVVPKKHRVAIFQYENTDRQEQFRLNRMLNGMSLTIDQVGDRIHWMNRDRLNLSTQTDQIRLENMVKQSGCDVVIYDSFSNMHQSKENDNIKLRAVLDTFTDINAKLGTACILIHHFGKPGDHNSSGPSKKYRIRGASSILDWAMSALVFTEHGSRKMNEGRILRELEFVKVRDGGIPRVKILERDDKESFLLDVTSDTLAMNANEITKVIYECMDDIGDEPSISELAKAMAVEAPVGFEQCKKIIVEHEKIKTLSLGKPTGRGGARKVKPLLRRAKEEVKSDDLGNLGNEDDITITIPDYRNEKQRKVSKQQQKRLF